MVNNDNKDNIESINPTLIIKDIINILNKYRLFIIIFILTTIASSITLTYAISEKYVAVTTIFYRPRETSLLRGKDTEAFGNMVPTAPFKVIKQTLNDAIKNVVVLKPVVKDLNLDKKIEKKYSNIFSEIFSKTKDFIREGISNIWMVLKYGRIIKTTPENDAIMRLAKNIDVSATQDSYIYLLKVKDKYPERAALIVDTVGEYLVKWLHDEYMKTTSERTDKLYKQIETVESELIMLREKKKKYLEENGYISISTETEKGLANLYELELELININAEITKISEEINNYEKTIKENGEELQLEDYQFMKSKIAIGKTNLKGLIAKKEQMTKSINKLKYQLDKLPLLDKTINELNLKIDAASKDLLQLKDLYTEALIQLYTNQTEAKVMYKAVVPEKPSQPIKIYHILLSAVLSTILSIGMAFVHNYFKLDELLKNNKKSCNNKSVNNKKKKKINKYIKLRKFIFTFTLVVFTGAVLGILIFYTLQKAGY